MTVILSPDYQRLNRKRKSDQMRRPDPEQLRKPSLDPEFKEEEEIDESLNGSQVFGYLCRVALNPTVFYYSISPES